MLNLFFKRFLALVLGGALVFGSSFCCPCSNAWADENVMDELKALRKAVQSLTQVVKEQQAEIDSLKSATPKQVVSSSSTGETLVVPQTDKSVGVYGAQTGLQAFNPEIGVVADMVAKITQEKEDAEGNDKFSVRELELAIGHDIDPYSRFDSTITLSDFEDVTVEEAYITHWGLPWDLEARVGRMRPIIGKATTLHRDQLDTTDAPLVVQKYLGIEGLFRTGVELSRLMPGLQEAWTHEITGGVMEGGIGEEGTLFGSSRNRPSYYAHLKNFWEVSEDSDLELGVTYLKGSRDDDGDLEVDAIGTDLTWTHHFNPTNKLKFQNEAYFQFRDETASGLDDQPFGFYSLLDYRLSPRFGIGGRFDYVEPVDNAVTNDDADLAYTGYLTFYQSEFARWRVQYQHVEDAAGGNDDRFFLQGTIAIGVHKHKLQ